MLILMRRAGQKLTIAPAAVLDLSTPVGELFLAGPIEVTVTEVDGPRVKIGISADHRFLILREELHHGEL